MRKRNWFNIPFVLIYPHPSIPGPQNSFHVLVVMSLINLPSINPLLICFHSDVRDQSIWSAIRRI